MKKPRKPKKYTNDTQMIHNSKKKDTQKIHKYTQMIHKKTQMNVINIIVNFVENISNLVQVC